MIRIFLFLAVLIGSFFNAQSQPINSLHPCKIANGKMAHFRDTTDCKKKHFWKAAGETFGLNVGLWAFDRYVLKGHYSYISLKTIKANFKHGFDWDNDHLSTNMFAHPYHGSLYFNAGRANGFNFWQSELFALGGSAMWELFMESEYPSKNDIIATPIGGAALGEVFYRTSDLILDNRTSGGERFGREALAFLISPMRGLTRIITGEAWEKKPVVGNEFGKPPYQLAISLGTRFLTSHDNDRFFKAGASARINLEYGDRYASSLRPYDYFSLLLDLNAMKTQPLLSRVEIMGSLLSKEVIDTEKSNLTLGMYQHFDFFDSDTIRTNYTPGVLEPCVVPYKLAIPASAGVGIMFGYKLPRFTFHVIGHANGILMGGVLSDFYRLYHRNYNWGTGFSAKLKLKGSMCDDKLSFSLNNRFYRLYSQNDWYSDKGYSPNPGEPPVDVEGDSSRGTVYHLEGQVNYKVWKSLSITTQCDWFNRSTLYHRMVAIDPSFSINGFFIDSNQLSFQLMLTYTL
ncbi:DUF3943 domain-containing protein [Phocaeicola coprophilus]|jgi:hypothetical protein|uniref:DUF3943 domain-containing protein n=1 Tax=Phocaeicola coprophilus TaxID=387090 RepID=UPI003AACBB01